ncbi:hypothetical protein KR51_00022300 [Rubidibacter lacunae KORDI 51-2]|uniref:Uncharacterized protein n=1 Tax=Rubidibacter lacunae KORDI 51-2 TaxID=582515 RepID=U5DJU0_9CHRO|nr:hypothetical protein [Rubidibacter lacunae]ERN41167.1 hypothetical protein KR51_00022300 [Rubidibacter lacunae KORDI 51-2]
MSAARNATPPADSHDVLAAVDVFSLAGSVPGIGDCRTFRVGELASILQRRLLDGGLGAIAAWFDADGVDGAVLRVGADAWESGRLHVHLSYGAGVATASVTFSETFDAIAARTCDEQAVLDVDGEAAALISPQPSDVAWGQSFGGIPDLVTDAEGPGMSETGFNLELVRDFDDGLSASRMATSTYPAWGQLPETIPGLDDADTEVEPSVDPFPFSEDSSNPGLDNSFAGYEADAFAGGDASEAQTLTTELSEVFGRWPMPATPVPDPNASNINTSDSNASDDRDTETELSLADVFSRFERADKSGSAVETAATPEFPTNFANEDPGDLDRVLASDNPATIAVGVDLDEDSLEGTWKDLGTT